jgi:tetratricopeptide (TPR) repeat protein
VWTDEIEGTANDTFTVLDSIVNRVVAGVAEEIERAETKRAVLKAPSSLDAWELYHRGLWHMYKFTGPDNEVAAKYFTRALERDQTFSRAHAGLSFTHFQNVFLGLKQERERETSLALETANRSIAADDRDPAAHWAMGRALWLAGERGAVPELERSVELSPNFALGHYTLGFVQAQSGDPNAAISAVDVSRQLSPFDPLQFGMLGSRAVAHLRMGEREAAAEWGVRAASRPNAHAHILAIAATTLALANRKDEARAFIARVREKLPGYGVEEFLRAFRFDAEAEKIIRAGAKIGGFA